MFCAFNPFLSSPCMQFRLLMSRAKHSWQTCA